MNKKDDKPQLDFTKGMILSVTIWGMVVIAFLGLSLAWSPFKRFSESITMSVLGQLGDYFGGLLNPAFGFCTLLVAIRVYLLQKDELKKTQHVLSEQAKIGAKALYSQRVFDLIKLYQITLDRVEHTNQGKVTRGLAALRPLLRDLIKFSDQSSFPPISDEVYRATLTSKIQNKPDLVGVFKTLEVLLRELNSGVERANENKELATLRDAFYAQISNDELVVAFIIIDLELAIDKLNVCKMVKTLCLMNPSFEIKSLFEDQDRADRVDLNCQGIVDKIVSADGISDNPAKG